MNITCGRGLLFLEEEVIVVLYYGGKKYVKSFKERGGHI